MNREIAFNVLKQHLDVEQVFKNTYITPKARKSYGQMTQEQRDKLSSIMFDFPES